MKLSISVVAISKKLRRLSRMRYHDFDEGPLGFTLAAFLLAEFQTLSSIR